MVFQWGCAGPAASKTVKGAGTGAAVGAVGGLLTGQDAGGIAAMGAAGAAIGATIGAIQESKERKRQDTLAQQRAYNQAIAMQKRSIDKEKATLQEELDIAEGFRISNEELEEMTGRAETAEDRLKILQAKRQAAIDRKKSLEEAEERERDALAEIERLEKELAELEGNDDGGGSGDGTNP
jgi:predicted RNase H-like nuclease (RuvC/YqgF family)